MTEPSASAETAVAVEEANGPASLGHRQVMVVMVALMLGLLLAALDQTIVATALPTIVADLHGAAHISWVVTAYMLAGTASTPLWGKLGDLYGRKIYFQASIVIFLVGSVLSGLSGSMSELIIFRFLQGLGSGGLMVGAQAIVGDVVSPRERGRYQGLFGAVFGLSSIIGPLLGGVIVEDLSWRWIFYINVPVGAVALVAVASNLPSHLRTVRHVIDYLGSLLLTLAATGMVLFTSLGGTSYPWGSPMIIGLGLGGLVMLIAFIFVERRAQEPIIPMRLFKNQTFSVTSFVGFIVGFAMFGAIVYLPAFLQIVDGASPTVSGLDLLPLMAGVLVVSIFAGQRISKHGRYRLFPIVGTALVTLGIFLLSLMTTSTSYGMQAIYMAVLGMGLGAVMQVLVIVVQNAVAHSELGVATSSATFFRSIGGSFGTAVFGAIFANVIVHNITTQLHGHSLPAGTTSSSLTPAMLAKLPPAVHHGISAAYAQSIHTVFLIAIPIAALSFIATWLIPHVELRKDVGAVSPGSSAAATEVELPLSEPIF